MMIGEGQKFAFARGMECVSRFSPHSRYEQLMAAREEGNSLDYSGAPLEKTKNGTVGPALI